jgi:CysZ protein
MPEAKNGVKRDDAFTRFLRGAGYFGRGLSFIFAERLWPWLLAPTLLTAALTVLAVWIGWHFGGAWVDARAAGHWVVLASLIRFVLWIVVAGMTFVAVLVVGLVASAPFAGPLSARIEARRTGQPPPKTGARDMIEDLVHTIASLSVYLAIAGIILMFQLVLSPLSPFLGVLGFCVTAKYLAFDNLDFPLSRRKMNFNQKWAWLKAHKAETNGLGALVALLTFVPGLGLFVPTIAAAGATLLYLDLEAAAPR